MMMMNDDAALTTWSFPLLQRDIICHKRKLLSLVSEAVGSLMMCRCYRNGRDMEDRCDKRGRRLEGPDHGGGHGSCC